MTRIRFTRREKRVVTALAVAGAGPLAMWAVLHTLIPAGWAGYLAGLVSGAALMVIAARPRVAVRVHLRGGTRIPARTATRTRRTP